MTEKDMAETAKLNAEANKLNAEAEAIRGKELRRWAIWISIIAAGQSATPTIIKELTKVL